MLVRKLNDVFVEIDKYCFIFKAVGLFNLVYSLGEFKVSRSWFVLSFFTVCPFLVFNIYLVIFKWSVNIKNLYDYMGISQIILVVLCVFIMWLVCRINLESLNKCLRKVQIVDYYLFSVGEAVTPSRPSKVIILVILIILFSFCIRLPSYDSLHRCFISFTMYYPYVLMFMVHLLMDWLFTILFQRFQAITNALQKCFALHGKKAVVLSEKMVFCYECLSSAGERLNNFFSFQILSILTAIFTISFSEVYAVINLFYESESLMNRKVVFINKVCWSTITYLTIWRFGHRFATISDKAKEFNLLLYRLMIEDKSNEILYSEKLSVHFTMKREIVFTACGLFQLNYKLVHSMIASATTYLVILIQFGQLSSSGAQTSTYKNFSTSNYEITTPLPTVFSLSYQDYISS